MALLCGNSGGPGAIHFPNIIFWIVFNVFRGARQVNDQACLEKN